MELKALYCPNCGAPINFDTTGREYIFCPFCGQQLFLQDLNRTEHVERIIDEAEIVRARLELEKQREKGRQRRDFLNTLLTIIIVVAIFIGIFLSRIEDMIKESHGGTTNQIQTETRNEED